MVDGNTLHKAYLAERQRLQSAQSEMHASVEMVEKYGVAIALVDSCMAAIPKLTDAAKHIANWQAKHQEILISTTAQMAQTLEHDIELISAHENKAVAGALLERFRENHMATLQATDVTLHAISSQGEILMSMLQVWIDSLHSLFVKEETELFYIRVLSIAKYAVALVPTFGSFIHLVELLKDIHDAKAERLKVLNDEFLSVDAYLNTAAKWLEGLFFLIAQAEVLDEHGGTSVENRVKVLLSKHFKK